MRRITVSTDDFDFRDYAPGNPGIVATVDVPKNKVWRTDTGQPIVLALPTKQTATVAANATTTVTLDERAPVPDFLDAPDAGTSEAAIVLEAAADGATVTVDSVTTAEGFVTDVTIAETGGTGTDVDVYSVVGRGTVTLQRRNAGKSNVSDDLQAEDALSLAFAAPDSPESDRQLRWEASTRGVDGVLAPKFKLDVVFYDDSIDVVANEAPSNLLIELPLVQRSVRNDEDPAALRRRITNSMRA
jgi:hypothetical protein